MIRSQLIRNIGATGTLQLVNYALPFITLPYLTRTVGVDAWGKLAYTQLIISYLAIIANWGFPISATRLIATLRNDNAALVENIRSIWTAQLLLTAALATATLPVLLIPNLKEQAEYVIWGSIALITSMFFPSWAFQGLEHLRESAIFQISGRLAATLGTFLMVHQPSDAPLALAVIAIGNALAALVAQSWLRRKMGLKFRLSSWSAAKKALSANASVFIGTAWISIYTSAVPALLGILAGPTASAIFLLADRARNAGQAICAPVSTAIFPRLSYLFHVDPRRARELAQVSVICLVTASTAASLTLFFLADPIVQLLGGRDYSGSADVLRWLSALPVLIAISNLFGIQIMIPNQRHSAFNKIVATAALLAALIGPPLIITNGPSGAAIALLICELAITLAMGLYLARENLLPFNFSQKNDRI